MPNQEVLDCQPFSELCTGVDLILSLSATPEKKRELCFCSSGTEHKFSGFSFLSFLNINKTDPMECLPGYLAEYFFWTAPYEYLFCYPFL